MSEWQQVVVTVIGPVTLYFIYRQKKLDDRVTIVEERLNVAHHRNYKLRILLNHLVAWIRNFWGNAFEVMEVSRDSQQPVTDKQIQRLRRMGTVDDILKKNKSATGELMKDD